MIEQINSWQVSFTVGVWVLLITFLYFVLSHKVSKNISKETSDTIILEAIKHTQIIVTQEIERLDETQNKKLDQILAKLNTLQND